MPDLFNLQLEGYYDREYSTDSEGHCLYDDMDWYVPDIMSEWIKINNLIDSNVAEIGIGTGYLSDAYFGGTTPTWDGYDMSYRGCRRSEGKYKYIKRLDITKQSLPKKYDTILACGVFSFFHLDHTCLQNIHDSLNEGGTLIASFPRRRNYWHLSGMDKQEYFEVIKDTNTFSGGYYRQLMNEKERQYHQIKVLKKVSK
jgi:predicted TPR repeat methyltransferase